MLPVYPVALIGFMYAAQRWSALWKGNAVPGAIGMVATIHFLALAAFSVGPIRYAFSNETADAYLDRTVIAHSTARWANSNLAEDDKLFTAFRQTLYFLDVRYFFAIPMTQNLIELRDGYTSPARFAGQLAKHRISHILISTPLQKLQPIYYGQLLENGCIEPIKTFRIVRFPSRTLKMFQHVANVEATVFKFHAENCPLLKSP